MSEINAIATNNYILHNIDAKKLYVQEPLFTANSGDAVYVGWRPDETVLYSAPTTNGVSAGQLTESKNNFSTLRYDVGYSGGRNNNEGSVLIDIPASYTGNWLNYSFGAGGANLYYAGAKIVWTNDTTFAINHGTCIVHNENTTTVSGVSAYNAGCRLCINKIIGVNRISGSNT